jgi:hypothetical protein
VTADSSMSDKPQYWYAAKRYGWGWGPPTSWHGWVVLVLLIADARAGALLPAA